MQRFDYNTIDTNWLLEAFKSYVNSCDSIIVGEIPLQKTAEIYQVTRVKPLTKQGFFVFCFETYNASIRYLFSGDKNINPDLLATVEYITEKIYANQLEQALLGNYNAGLVQKVLGIADKKEVEVNGSIQINFGGDKDTLNLL